MNVNGKGDLDGPNIPRKIETPEFSEEILISDFHFQIWSIEFANVTFNF
jgi:hypothetical protein